MAGDQDEASDAHEIGLDEVLGAIAASSVQILTLYIPNKDRDGNRLDDQEVWVRQAADLLARIGGGVTVQPPCRGGWLNPETNDIVWEEPILVYTYVKPKNFADLVPELRGFPHRLGRETNQGEVACEFDRTFFRIVEFDCTDEGQSR
jgi:hypothetical protein